MSDWDRQNEVAVSQNCSGQKSFDRVDSLPGYDGDDAFFLEHEVKSFASHSDTFGRP